MDATKGNGVKAACIEPAEIFTKNNLDRTPFPGTSNPRYLRVIQALLVRPRRCKDIDSIASCSNGADLISQLRELWLNIPCIWVNFIDSHGFFFRSGIYYLTTNDRRKINHWILMTARGVK